MFNQPITGNSPYHLTSPVNSLGASYFDLSQPDAKTPTEATYKSSLKSRTASLLDRGIFKHRKDDSFDSSASPCPSSRSSSLWSHNVENFRRNSEGSLFDNPNPFKESKYDTFSSVVSAEYIAPHEQEVLVSDSTPLEDLPYESWREYQALYSQYLIEVQHPPSLPLISLMEYVKNTPGKTSKMEIALAPHPVNELYRQSIVESIDLLGLRRLAESKETKMERKRSISLLRSTGSSPKPPVPIPTMEHHPILHSIINSCRELFDSKIAVLSIMDGGMQRLLVQNGFPHGIHAIPRELVFCGHTILNGKRGLYISNSSRDKRFVDNFFTQHFGPCFYAGVPIMGPKASQVDHLPVIIGTLYVVDSRPRDAPSDETMSKLHELADKASYEIERWALINTIPDNHRMRTECLGLNLPFLKKRRSVSRNSWDSVSSFQMSPSTNNLRTMSTDSQTMSDFIASTNSSSTSLPSKESFHLRKSQTRLRPSLSTAFGGIFNNSAPKIEDELDIFAPEGSEPKLEWILPPPKNPRRGSYANRRRNVPHPNEKELPPVPTQTTKFKMMVLSKSETEIFDTVLTLIATKYKLSFAYILAFDVFATSDKVEFEFVAAYGLPNPPPELDVPLHLRAFRAPEGGLLYKNPKAGYVKHPGYTSGILLPILQVRKRGYLLCGYYDKPEEDFEPEKVRDFMRIVERLECLVEKIK